MVWERPPMVRFAINMPIAVVTISNGRKKQREVTSSLKTAPPDYIWTVWDRPPMALTYANIAAAPVPINSGRYSNAFPTICYFHLLFPKGETSHEHKKEILPIQIGSWGGHIIAGYPRTMAITSSGKSFHNGESYNE